MIRLLIAIAVLIAAAIGAAAWHFRSSDTRLTALPYTIEAAVATLPRPQHVVVVVEENKEYSDIAGKNAAAPYLNELIARGTLFTHSYGVAHPSQPNYLALFAGITNENGDGCPPRSIDSNAPNLATELAAAHRSFAGYAEGLPAAGFRGCRQGEYARKHVPWADFANVPDSKNLPFSALPPYAKLPTVAFIIPNLLDDMHSASVSRGDTWLREHAGALIAWAMTHDTLVIITWDESDDAVDNHIPTIFVGPMVKPGRSAQPVTHYSVLRTIEQMYGLPYAGRSAQAAPIAGIWKEPRLTGGT